MTYIASYYSQTMVPVRERGACVQDVSCDVCIVGGGLAGLTAALYLARGGRAVVLLEARHVGWGASGLNGGFVSPGYAAGHAHIARIAGERHADALHRVSIDGMVQVRTLIEELAISGAHATPGILRTVRYDAADELKAEQERVHRRYAYELELLGKEEVRARLHSRKYFQALRDKTAFHFHPLNYVQGLAGEIERLGGAIFEQSAALSLQTEGAEKIVGTGAGGTVRCRSIVLATGGYTGALVPALRRAFLPIHTYVLVSEAQPDLIAQAIKTTDGVGDNRRAGDYYRLIDGGRRLMWGGRISTRGASPQAAARQLRSEIVTTFPQLADLKTHLAWSGTMSYARHMMPQIGELEPDVWFCTAFGGHGMNTTSAAGKAIAAALLGDRETVSLFAPFGLPWAGGAAGLAVAQLTFWKLQLQDWWTERRARQGEGGS